MTYRLYVDHTGGMSKGRGETTRASIVAQRSQATRVALIQAARRLFVDKGYFATGTRKIVHRGGKWGPEAPSITISLTSRHCFRPCSRRSKLTCWPPPAAVRPPPVPSPSCESGYSVSWTRHQPSRRAANPAGGRSGRAGLAEVACPGRSLRSWRHPIPAGASPRRRRYSSPTSRCARPMLLAAVDEAALYIANAPDPPIAKNEAIAAMDRLLHGISTESDRNRTLYSAPQRRRKPS